jgi:predicted enzyme related to lactoylglutathione lyase
MTRVVAFLTSMAVAGLVGLLGSQNPDAELHGKFTSDIKPVLYVADVEVSAEFFRVSLGFGFDGFASRGDGSPYYAEMVAGERKFGLHEPTSNGQETRVGQARLYFRVLNLAAHRQRVALSGGEPGEIIETDWMDMFIVRDPDGNEIVFAVTDPERHSIDPW